MIKAQWNKLVMANYAVSPDVLDTYLPYQTVYDQWKGECFISLVGFMFRDTSILGIKFPYHTHFEEVNLRFYVKHSHSKGVNRGVVFIKEIVPLSGVTFVANTIYKEHYETLPMKHTWNITPDQLMVEYKWKSKKWNSLKIVSDPNPLEIVDDSLEKFFTDQHWGYTQVYDKLTMVYEVAHPNWQYYKTIDYSIDVDFGHVYGEAFSFLTNQKPDSVFLSDGSVISLKKAMMLKA
jgi:uncharacterized protein YqjF (DUF2071 family)